MEKTSSYDDEIKSEEHVDAATSSVTSQPLKSAPKTPAERQRQYRLRQKKLKEAQNIHKNKPAKKTRAEYQKEYRLRQKLKKLNNNKKLNDNNLKLNSSSAEMIPKQEAGPSEYVAPVTTAQLAPSSPDAGPTFIKHETVIDTIELLTPNRKAQQTGIRNISKVRTLNKAQKCPTEDHNFDEICQLPSQPILALHLPNGEMRLSNQLVYIPASKMDDSINPFRSSQIKTETPFEETMESEEIVFSAEGQANPNSIDPLQSIQIKTETAFEVNIKSEEIMENEEIFEEQANHENSSVNYRNEAPVYTPININVDRNGSIVASTSVNTKETRNQPSRRNSIHKNVKQNLPTILPPTALDNNLKEKVMKTYNRVNKMKSNRDNETSIDNTATHFDTSSQIKEEIIDEPIENELEIEEPNQNEFYFRASGNENQYIDENNESGDSNQKKIDVSSSVVTDINAHSVCSACKKSFPKELFATHECVNKVFKFVYTKSKSQLTPDSHVEYLNDKESDNQLLCFSCKKVFESADLLKSHRHSCMRLSPVEPETVDIPNELTCGFCEKTFENKTELKDHNSKTHFWCSICLGFWKTSEIAEQHKEIHKKYYCEACKCYFDSVRQFNYHEHKILHNKLIPSINIDKPFVCDRCPVRFDLKYKLIEHANSCKRPVRKISKKQMEFCCKICSKKFDVRYMYLRHVQSKCETKFKCRFYCNKVFETFESLERHIRTMHHNEEILWCRLCNLTFKEKTLLDSHMCHAFQCKLCSEMFLKTDFNKHKCFENWGRKTIAEYRAEIDML